METKELESSLEQFCGTEEWHRYSGLFHRTLLTDGALFLAEKAGAFWLMDVISSHRIKESFQVWKLHKDKIGTSWSITCDDGNGNILVTQVIEYSDFPIPDYKLYATWDGEHLIIMLPGEY